MIRKIVSYFDYQLGPRNAMLPGSSHASTPVADEDRVPTAFAKFGSVYPVPEDTGDMLAGFEATSNIGLENELYQASFARQAMPSPGAMSYSWETLGLAQQNQLGTGVYAPNIPVPTQPAGLQVYEVPTFGTPDPYDQISGMPLLQADYSTAPGAAVGPLNINDLSMVEWNIPSLESVPGFPFAANDPFPQRQKPGV